MRHSWCLSVLIAFAALAGYAAATTPVRAQAEAVPFRQGDIVTFGFQGGGSRQCRIEQIHGTFARCGNVSDRQGSNHWASRAHRAMGKRRSGRVGDEIP